MMNHEIVVRYSVPEHVLTLDDLATFVQESMRRDVPGDAIPKVRVSLRGGIKSIEIKGVKINASE